MATWGPLTQTGAGRWAMWGNGTTNHEAFAFTLQTAPEDIGALISNVTVFINNNLAQGSGNQPLYVIDLAPVDQGLNPTNDTITGEFESNGV